MKKMIMFFLLVSLSAFGFKIDDITFDQSLNSGYREYKVYNDSNKKIRYKVNVSNGKNEKVDVSKMVKVYPKVLSIEPRSFAILKVFGNSKEKLEKREYVFNLGFTPVIVPTIKKDKDKDKISGSTFIRLAPQIEMAGYGGNIDWSKSFEVKGLDLKKSSDEKSLEGTITVENKAYSGLSVGIKLYDEHMNTMDSVSLGRVAKEKVSTIKIKINNFKNVKEIKKIVFYKEEMGDIAEVDI